MNFASKTSVQGIDNYYVYNQSSNSMNRDEIEAHLSPANPIDDGSFNTSGDKETMEVSSQVRSQKEEIQILREQIAAASVRELQLRNEKYALERKFADLRMAVDERQNEAVTSALNELVRRKGDLEENLRLTHELKVVEGERYIFVSSMLGLLAEYGILPHAVNASAISLSVKHLHDQLQWKIRTSNDRIRELASAVGTQVESDSYHDNIHGFIPLTSQTTHGSTVLLGQHQNSNHYVDEQNMRPTNNNTSRYPHDVDLPDRTSLVPEGRRRQQSRSRNSDEFSFNVDRNVPEVLSDTLYDQGIGKTSAQERIELLRASSTYDKGASLISEELPGIEDFQIIGNATPGEKLLGCGYPVRGTSLCMFQWVRHLEDGTRQYIEGATNPEYVVTADDVDKLIAVECIPMDDQGRQGELVKIFANDQNKIICDLDMQQEIDMYISKGEASFSVLLLTDNSDNWEPTTVLIRRSGYQIKSNSNEAVLIAERFSKDLTIKIPFGLSTQVVLACPDGPSHPLSAPNVRMRDILVLTMRIFQTKALDEKRKK